jgi:uncharacterized protein YxjI
MHSLLQHNHYFVKEHTGIFKAANSYDIYTLDTNEHIINCREPQLGFFTKLFRFTEYKALTPFHIQITDAKTEQSILSVKRDFTIFRSVVSIFDEHSSQVGTLRKVFNLLKPSFEILDSQSNKIGTLQGNFIGWEFAIKDNAGNVLVSISKKWAGIGKELFTSADNYACVISDSVDKNDSNRILMLGAVMCIDMVLKER